MCRVARAILSSRLWYWSSVEDSWYGIDKGVTMAELRNSVFEIRLVAACICQQRTFLMKVVSTMYAISEGQPITGTRA